jgi:hypothetical protein
MGALQRSKGGVRTTPPVLQSLSESAFKLYEGRRGGARLLCAPLPKEAEALSATCGRVARRKRKGLPLVADEGAALLIYFKQSL